MAEWREALSIAKELLELRRGLGANYGILDHLQQVADLHVRLGEHREAVAYQVEALTAARGSSPFDLLPRINKLVSIYSSLGQYRDAKPLIKEACAITEKHFPPSHPQQLACRKDLADILCKLGDYTQAEPYLEEMLKITKEALWSSSSHPQQLACRKALADAYCKLGKYTQAAPVLEEVLSITKEASWCSAGDLVDALNDLAEAYSLLGNPKLQKIDSEYAVASREASDYSPGNIWWRAGIRLQGVFTNIDFGAASSLRTGE